MSEDQIKEIFDQLADHDRRIANLEGSKPKGISKTSTVTKVQKRSGKGEDLHLPIQKLHASGFFNDAKIDLDVVSELQRKLMTRKTPLRASVVNVLRNLVRDGVLERVEVTRNEKELIAYMKS